MIRRYGDGFGSVRFTGQRATRHFLVPGSQPHRASECAHGCRRYRQIPSGDLAARNKLGPSTSRCRTGPRLDVTTTPFFSPARGEPIPNNSIEPSRPPRPPEPRPSGCRVEPDYEILSERLSIRPSSLALWSLRPAIDATRLVCRHVDIRAHRRSLCGQSLQSCV